MSAWLHSQFRDGDTYVCGPGPVPVLVYFPHGHDDRIRGRIVIFVSVTFAGVVRIVVPVPILAMVCFLVDISMEVMSRGS